MRSSRVCIELPARRTVDVRSVSRDGLAAFSAPALPGFTPRHWSSRFDGTRPPSDFPGSLALLAFSACAGILVSAWWAFTSNKNRWDLTGCFLDMMCSEIVASDPRSPNTTRQIAVLDVAFCRSECLGRVRVIHAFPGSITFTVGAASPFHSSSLPFCVRFNELVTSPAATLDTGPRAKSTGPRAKSYPAGDHLH